MNTPNFDPPEHDSPPDWVVNIEEALHDPDIPVATAFVIRTALKVWYEDQAAAGVSYDVAFEDVEDVGELGCLNCGKPSQGALYCSRECCPSCPHGNTVGECDHCDYLSDIAYDSNRENS